MAAQLEEEGAQTNDTNQSDIVKWLLENNLKHVIPKFMEENMTMEELLEYAEDENAFKDYLNALGIPKASVHRICFKIKKKLKEKSSDNNINSNETNANIPSRVVITEQEDESIRKLNEYSNNIATLMTKLEQSNSNLVEKEQKVKSEINAHFNQLINIINDKQENILKKVKNISNVKQKSIAAKSQTLQEKQDRAKNAIKACNELIYNGNMDRAQRKQEVVSKADNILKDKIANNFADVSTDIIFEFNQETVATFISNVAEVYDDKHPIPIIVNIETKAITKTECAVHWNASLSQQDVNKKVSSKLYMKLENMNENLDEKEREQISSELIVFDKNKKNYEWKMNQLQQGTTYKMQISLFESRNNDNNIPVKRNDMKPLLFNFKTSVVFVDKWNVNLKSAKMKISDGNVVENIEDGGNWRNIYGEQICEHPNKYHWKLKIVNITADCSNGYKIAVGVKQTNTKNETDKWLRNINGVYGVIGSSPKLVSTGNDGEDYGQKFEKVNDTIDVWLDLQNYTLSFSVNDQKYGVAHQLPSEKYRLLLGLIRGRQLQIVSTDYY